MNTINPSAPVGVVGAGTMGLGIAQIAAVAGHRVHLIDSDRDTAARAPDNLGTQLSRAVGKGRISPDEAAEAASRVTPAATIDELSECALVVEAVVEDLGVKHAVFSALERVCGNDTVLASNTSSLSIDDIAAELAHPGRVAGMHFFNPAPVLALVEVVAGAKTEHDIVDLLVTTATAWGKTPVRAASTPGFIVNRVARPYYGEAFRLLESGGLDPATIDALLHEAGGFPMGPFELADLVGHDVNLAVSRSMWEASGHDPRFAPAAAQQTLVSEGRLGRKSGRGIYAENEPRPAPATAATRPDATHHWSGEFEPDSTRWQISSGDVVLRPTDGRTATQHTGGGPGTVVLVDLALDYTRSARVGIAAPEHVPAAHVDTAISVLQTMGYQVTVLPDVPGLVVSRTVAMLAAFAADAVDAGVATPGDVDTAMRLGVRYPRGPYEWGDALGWGWVTGVLDALAAAEDPVRYRVSSGLRSRARTTPHTQARTTGAALARRAADAMWSGDAASHALGMTIVAVTPGHATVSMRVRDDMVNGHGYCHGGMIFALADTAFAFACNSYDRRTLAQSCDITFVSPARAGDVLVAYAQERHRAERSGIYDVTVVRDDPGAGQQLVAEFRGHAREITGTLTGQ